MPWEILWLLSFPPNTRKGFLLDDGVGEEKFVFAIAFKLQERG